MQRSSYSVSRGGRAMRYQQAAFGGPRQFRPARGQGTNDLWRTGERYYEQNVGRPPARNTRPRQQTVGTSIWSPAPTGSFMAMPKYRPGSSTRSAKGTSASPGLGRAPTYHAGATANPYGVGALFGN